MRQSTRSLSARVFICEYIGHDMVAVGYQLTAVSSQLWVIGFCYLAGNVGKIVAALNYETAFWFWLTADG